MSFQQGFRKMCRIKMTFTLTRKKFQTENYSKRDKNDDKESKALHLKSKTEEQNISSSVGDKALKSSAASSNGNVASVTFDKTSVTDKTEKSHLKDFTGSFPSIDKQKLESDNLLSNLKNIEATDNRSVRQTQINERSDAKQSIAVKIDDELKHHKVENKKITLAEVNNINGEKLKNSESTTLLDNKKSSHSTSRYKKSKTVSNMSTLLEGPDSFTDGALSDTNVQTIKPKLITLSNNAPASLETQSPQNERKPAVDDSKGRDNFVKHDASVERSSASTESKELRTSLPQIISCDSKDSQKCSKTPPETRVTKETDSSKGLETEAPICKINKATVEEKSLNKSEEARLESKLKSEIKTKEASSIPSAVDSLPSLTDKKNESKSAVSNEFSKADSSQKTKLKSIVENGEAKLSNREKPTDIKSKTMVNERLLDISEETRLEKKLKSDIKIKDASSKAVETLPSLLQMNDQSKSVVSSALNKNGSIVTEQKSIAENGEAKLSDKERPIDKKGKAAIDKRPLNKSEETSLESKLKSETKKSSASSAVDTLPPLTEKKDEPKSVISKEFSKDSSRITDQKSVVENGEAKLSESEKPIDKIKKATVDERLLNNSEATRLESILKSEIKTKDEPSVSSAVATLPPLVEKKDDPKLIISNEFSKSDTSKKTEQKLVVENGAAKLSDRVTSEKDQKSKLPSIPDATKQSIDACLSPQTQETINCTDFCEDASPVTPGSKINFENLQKNGELESLSNGGIQSLTTSPCIDKEKDSGDKNSQLKSQNEALDVIKELRQRKLSQEKPKKLPPKPPPLKRYGLIVRQKRYVRPTRQSSSSSDSETSDSSTEESSEEESQPVGRKLANGKYPEQSEKLRTRSDASNDSIFSNVSNSTTCTILSNGESKTTFNQKLRFRQYGVEDFGFLKLLGKGSFGKVLLAELKNSEMFFAIKCLKKDVVLEDDDVESTMIERRVLALGTQHPYLCKLYCTFQTESYLYFVMEYLNGGDLMFHIQEDGRFEEKRAMFYGAEIVSALKFLHKRGIVYRDIKLDNIMLDREGHVRIVDFGMCQCRIYMEECMPSNFCGTPTYIAPEIVQGKKYNESVDWWSFGVLLYEMLIGRSPFQGTDEDELFWSICNEEPQYPSFISKHATHMLGLLLVKSPEKRLGMPACPAGCIKDHAFFDPINWDAIERKQITPVFKPKVSSPSDTSNFDSSFTMDSASLDPIDANVLKSMDQDQFNGFSYTNPHLTG